MTVIRLVLIEVAAIPFAVLLIRAVLQHACDPRQIDRRLYVGRHHLAHAGGTR